MHSAPPDIVPDTKEVSGEHETARYWLVSLIPNSGIEQALITIFLVQLFYCFYMYFRYCKSVYHDIEKIDLFH